MKNNFWKQIPDENPQEREFGMGKNNLFGEEAKYSSVLNQLQWSEVSFVEEQKCPVEILERGSTRLFFLAFCRFYMQRLRKMGLTLETKG